MTTHSPGSPKAIKAGCTCDPIANHHGVGEPINGGKNRRVYITLYCPLHSDFKDPKKTE